VHVAVGTSVERYTSPDSGANVQLATRDAATPEDSVISVLTDRRPYSGEAVAVTCRRSACGSRGTVGSTLS
jgi:hypothetical protein